MQRIAWLPSARTLALLALASPLVHFSVAAAIAVDGLVIVLAILDGRRTCLPRLTRHAATLSSLAAVTNVGMTVTNPSRGRVIVRLTDDLDARLRRLPDSDGTDPWEAGIRLEVPPKSSVQCSYQIVPRTRGFLELGAIHMRARSPWGFAWRCHSHVTSHTIQVQPGVRDLLRSGSRHSLAQRQSRPGHRRTRQWGDGREFESLRDYVPGDDPRTIDHKVSAKRRKFVVRNYEAERSQNIVLAIDCGRHMRERLSPIRERMDYALSASMMLASRAQRFRDRMGIVIFDDQVRHVSPARRADPAWLAPVLAGVETRLVEPNYPMAFATLAQTFRKRSLVVLFCDIIDQSVSRALVDSVTRIKRTHLPLAVAISNPELGAAARRRVTTPDDAYFRAAAEELLQSRATTIEGMRQSGVLVVDTTPGDALPKTLDKFVEIKERGLL